MIIWNNIDINNKISITNGCHSVPSIISQQPFFPSVWEPINANIAILILVAMTLLLFYLETSQDNFDVFLFFCLIQNHSNALKRERKNKCSIEPFPESQCTDSSKNRLLIITSVVFFREFRRLRHKIHIGLFLSFILESVSWIISAISQVKIFR